MENNQAMTPQEALNLLSQAASVYRGTLQEHTALQDAVRTLSNAIQPQEDTEEDKQ